MSRLPVYIAARPVASNTHEVASTTHNERTSASPGRSTVRIMDSIGRSLCDGRRKVLRPPLILKCTDNTRVTLVETPSLSVYETRICAWDEQCHTVQQVTAVATMETFGGSPKGSIH